MPVKQRPTSSLARPTASKICAPLYDWIVEIPILEIVFSRPLAMPLTTFFSAVSTSSTPWTLPFRTSSSSESNITYGLIALAP